MAIKSNAKTHAVHKIVKSYCFKRSVNRTKHGVLDTGTFFKNYLKTFKKEYEYKLSSFTNDQDGENLYRSRRIYQKVKDQNQKYLYALCPLCDPFEPPNNNFYPDAELREPKFHQVVKSASSPSQETFENHMLNCHGILKDDTKIAEPFIGFIPSVRKTPVNGLSRRNRDNNQIEVPTVQEQSKISYSLNCVCPYAKKGTKEACNAIFKILQPKNAQTNPYQKYINHVATCHFPEKCDKSLLIPSKEDQKYHTNKEIEYNVTGHGFLPISSPNCIRASEFAKTQRETSKIKQKAAEMDGRLEESDVEYKARIRFKNGLYKIYLKEGILTPGEYLKRISAGL